MAITAIDDDDEWVVPKGEGATATEHGVVQRKISHSLAARPAGRKLLIKTKQIHIAVAKGLSFQIRCLLGMVLARLQ